MLKNKTLIDYQNEIKTEGYTIIKQLFDKSIVDKTLDLIHKYHEPNFQWSGLPSRDVDDKRIYVLPSFNTHFTNLVTTPLVVDILKFFLNDPYYRWLSEDYPNFIINSCSARSSGQFLDLHIDSTFPFLGDYPIGIVSIYAIEPSNLETGCTFGVPGSHKSGAFTNRNYTKLENFILNPGDCLLIDSRLWHGAGINNSGNSRWTVNCHYTRWFVKQDHDLTKIIPQNIYKQLSEVQKIMLGYCSRPSDDPKKRINIKTGLESL